LPYEGNVSSHPRGFRKKEKSAMPTYEYQCDACEHNFDEFQSINDKPLRKCPKCGKKKLRRVFGAGAAVLFKGSGFYETDYRSESYQKAAKADQEAPKSSSSTPASDTKGASPSESSSKDKGAGAKGSKSSG
jgi:putative regulatory protein, FmdB family